MKKKMKNMLKQCFHGEFLDEAIAWQDLAERLFRIYKGKYSYKNILNALTASETVFKEKINLEELQDEKKS